MNAYLRRQAGRTLEKLEQILEELDVGVQERMYSGARIQSAREASTVLHPLIAEWRQMTGVAEVLVDMLRENENLERSVRRGSALCATAEDAILRDITRSYEALTCVRLARTLMRKPLNPSFSEQPSERAAADASSRRDQIP